MCRAWPTKADPLPETPDPSSAPTVSAGCMLGAVVGGDVVVSLCVDVASVRMMVMIKKLMMIMTIILIVINTN